MNSTSSRLKAFSEYLNRSWPALQPFFESDKTGSLKCDWLQANWELLMEEDGQFLEVYGEGADCCGENSRVLFPEQVSTHRVVCVPEDGGDSVFDHLGSSYKSLRGGVIVFEYLVALKDKGYYSEEPPFNFVLAEQNGTEILLELSQIEFKIVEI